MHIALVLCSLIGQGLELDSKPVFRGPQTPTLYLFVNNKQYDRLQPTAAALMRTGYRTVMLIAEDEPDLVEHFKLKVTPTWLMVVNNKVLDSNVGYLTATSAAQFYWKQYPDQEPEPKLTNTVSYTERPVSYTAERPVSYSVPYSMSAVYSAPVERPVTYSAPYSMSAVYSAPTMMYGGASLFGYGGASSCATGNCSR